MPHPPHSPGSEPDLQRLLRDLDGIVWVLDAGTGACTFGSDAIRRLLGYEPEDSLNDPDFRVHRLHPEDRAHMEDLWSRLETAGGSFDVMYHLRAGAGSSRPVRPLGPAAM